MVNGSRRRGCGWIALLAAGIATTVGCGNATDGPARPQPGPSTGVQTVDDFTERFAARFCESIAACCDARGFATSNCKATLQEQLRAQLQVITSDPKVQFNASAASACIDAYAAAHSACTDPSAYAQADDACELLFQGTVPLGGECGRSAECVKSGTDYVSCTTGVCVLSPNPPQLVDMPHLRLGEACVSSCEGTRNSASCTGNASAEELAQVGACWVQDGLVCASGVCARAPRAGEACASSNYCEVAAHCVSRVCVTNLSSGPCTQDRECLAPAICDYTLKTCVPLKANGEPCENSDQCLGGECYQDRCRAWTVARTNTCLGVLDD